MEDEDGESKIMDMWSMLGDQQVKDSFSNTLKHSIENAYTDTIGEEKQRIRHPSVNSKELPAKTTSAGSKNVFKGFKKRILAQAQETQTIKSRSLSQERQPLHSNVSPKNNKEKKTETKRGKITEYAQYLGLQPSSKSKCSKCHSSVKHSSIKSQCTCNATMTPMQGSPSTSEVSSQSSTINFKITRKVYLCAACGTYFENWNLFLHMRDIHKRHICLFCLGMFGQAERLSYHLSKKHSVPEMTFNTVEDFYNAFKGSCYLVCCTCEKVFSETDNFYNHFCSPPSKQDATPTVCTLCRQTGMHASTCALAIENSKETNSVVSVPTNVQAGTVSASVIETSKHRGTPRRIIKNNRSKHGEDSTLNSYQQHTKKASTKSTIPQHSENHTDSLAKDGSDITSNSIRDTVSETIMEVSRCIDDSSNEDAERKNDNMSSMNKTYEERPLVQNNNQLEPYDSVTQTIMEVSRCVSDTDDEDVSNQNVSDTAEVSSNTELQTNTCRTDSTSLEATKEIAKQYDSSCEQEKMKSISEENERADIIESRIDSELHSSSSSTRSPVSRSLFSPQHESQQDLQLKEDVFPDDGSKHTESVESPAESQKSVSFNAVQSDRSLVIKICTNKNSQFSVSSATANTTGSRDARDVCRDSEENNNAESSTSDEKLSKISEKGKDNASGYQVNEEDSDSDSNKLAVVDSNEEENEDGEEMAEVKNAIETEIMNAAQSKDDKESTNIQIGEEDYTVDTAVAVAANGELSVPEQCDDATKDGIDDNAQLPPRPSDGIVLAGEDVPPIDLNVEGTLDSTEIEDLLKKCIEAASPYCVYCNHARHIAVNGKQLGLHMLAEHRFQPQHPAIIIQQEQFVTRVKKSLDELESRCFNLDSYNSTSGTYNIQDIRTYECFHCRFHFTVHKELYLHNRKMHQKTILICIMCKSTFYSYSELLCHLCPGTYSPNINVKYRCCLCPIAGLPSAFRLMVHLRKRHHACDVCLECTGNQQRLSNHVWKHKLHHLCYRCGIAYRNKPDITKHLFWKHGTESVLCKKCLQKKWPHIYHFCIPPTAFVCEECGSSFSRAVALKVHKRLHSGDSPYVCGECSERFISQRLLTKHEKSHKEVPIVDVCSTDATNNQNQTDDTKPDKESAVAADATSGGSECGKETKETVKKVVDVYDLPPLNLSSESDSDAEEAGEEKIVKSATNEVEKDKSTEEMPKEEQEVTPQTEKQISSPLPMNDSLVEEERNEEERNEEEKKQEAKIMDGIWDNFKNYTANLEMQESAVNNFAIKEAEPEIDVAYLRSIVLADHDYCVVWSEKDKNTDDGGMKEDERAADGDYCRGDKSQRSPSADSAVQNNAGCESDANKKKVKSPKKKNKTGSTSSSDSSSDSDSSSCSCGTNCSCSSSSSGSSSSSSSSSDSDSSVSESSPRKLSSRKERRKDKETAQQENQPEENADKGTSVERDNVGIDVPTESVQAPKPLLRESDLETDETDTDEDFYDEHPQQLANKLLAEKRNQLLLLAAVAPASAESGISLNNGIADESCVTPSPDPPSLGAEEQPEQQKRKIKTKKRKKGERGRQRNATPVVESLKLNIPKSYYQKNATFSGSLPSAVAAYAQQHQAINRSSNFDVNEIQSNVSLTESQPSSNQNIASEMMETKRSSKRKRIPKRFYGDSSDEETEKQSMMKWRKVETPSFVTNVNQKPTSPRLPYSGGGKSMAYRMNMADSHAASIAAGGATVASASESEEPADSSSDSSDSDTEMSIQQHQPQTQLPTTNPAVPERAVNLYCYCQCPYDEVSEMIACDGEDCRIEWFHFECVGIMVPPKGKWYCPDCRKKHGILQNNDDYFD